MVWLEGLKALWPWENQAAFLKSEFFAAFFGSLTGAGSAYLLGFGSERRKAALQEIAAANASIALAHSVINTVVTLKIQHVNPLLAIYRETFRRWVATEEVARKGGYREAFVGPIDMRSLLVPFMPGADLQNTVVERVTESVRAPMIAVVLRQAVDGLAASIVARNETMKTFEGQNLTDVVPPFFGIVNEFGNADERYPDNLTAIAAQTDDCIYFGMLLQDILTAHVRKIRRRIWLGKPGLLSFDYPQLKTRGLLPDRSQYQSYEKQFRPDPYLRWYNAGKNAASYLSQFKSS